jgi:hypothetical protein
MGKVTINKLQKYKKSVIYIILTINPKHLIDIPATERDKAFLH